MKKLGDSLFEEELSLLFVFQDVLFVPNIHGKVHMNHHFGRGNNLAEPASS